MSSFVIPIIIFMAALVWGVVHSLLAANRTKKMASQQMGAAVNRFYRLVYNLFAGVSLLPVLALPGLLPDHHLYAIPSPWLIVTVLLQLAAGSVLIYGVIQTGALRFLGLSQAIGDTANQDQLVTGGLYRYVRHPLYAAGLLFIWLTPVMTANLLALYLAFTIYIVAGARLEERKLQDAFGPAYTAYRSRTPMFLPFR